MKEHYFKLMIQTAVALNIFFGMGCCGKKNRMINMVWWTNVSDIPMQLNETGQMPFVQCNCTFQNCYITTDVTYLDDIVDFDVLLFHSANLYRDTDIPTRRTETQQYILVAIEPAQTNQLYRMFNNLINLTWTYKLDSDVPLPYFSIYNERNEKIGPKTEMHWIDINEMNETKEDIIRKLQKKTKAAVWFVSHCQPVSKREIFVRSLQTQLAKYNQSVDVYGNCSKQRCPNEEVTTMEACNALIETTYYFYLAFENALCDDYVTEKLLNGLQNYAVPIVFGGANYTRFMPEGIYLDARKYGPKKLAKEMMSIINDQKRYYDFFRWHNHYSYHHSRENHYYHEICGMCALLNNKTRMAQRQTYRLSQWWNGVYDRNT